MNQESILCLNFDGVIHNNISIRLGPAAIPDLPVQGAIEFIARAAEHFIIAVHSSRSYSSAARDAMAIYIEKHWIAAGYEGPPPVYFPEYKPPAILTIDDRAITFTGVWPEIATLLAFKPWNK